MIITLIFLLTELLAKPKKHHLRPRFHCAGRCQMPYGYVFLFGQQHNYFDLLTQNSFQKTVKKCGQMCVVFFQALPRKLFKNIKLGRSSDLLHRFAAFPSLRTVAGVGNNSCGAYSSGTVRDFHPIPF